MSDPYPQISYSATTWMTDNYSQLASKQLSEIVFFGTHDSGMSELHGTKVNIAAQGACTQTQTLTIGDQITVAGARYLDIRPAYYEADALSDVSSGYYAAHWSTFGANSWVGLIGRSLDNICQDLATAMSSIGKGEVVLLEVSHSKYLPEGLFAEALSADQQQAVISQLLTTLGDYAFKWQGSNTPPLDFLSQKLSDVISDPTSSGPVAFLWDSDGAFASCGYGPADGYFTKLNLDYYNSWGDADTSDPTTLINDLTSSL